MTQPDDEITPAELNDLLKNEEEVRIVDIRSPSQFERGAIPDSENIPFGELPQRVEALDGAERVVTVCPHGKASLQAMRLIESYEGLGEADVRSLEGGLDAWSRDYGLDSDGNEESEESDGESAAEAPF
ncbi:rhodanese-like domain-containing protein [Halalkalicoccus salilacus]|uniref:rhodanese-like domain-containing protein n=1 Tax=Halalkalicoccus salilacus TaxID=3117459 RepID=UPI00300EE96B